jgi:hypothetical protein
VTSQPTLLKERPRDFQDPDPSGYLCQKWHSGWILNRSNKSSIIEYSSQEHKVSEICIPIPKHSLTFSRSDLSQSSHHENPLPCCDRADPCKQEISPGQSTCKQIEVGALNCSTSPTTKKRNAVVPDALLLPDTHRSPATLHGV